MKVDQRRFVSTAEVRLPCVGENVNSVLILSTFDQNKDILLELNTCPSGVQLI